MNGLVSVLPSIFVGALVLLYFQLFALFLVSKMTNLNTVNTALVEGLGLILTFIFDQALSTCFVEQ